MMMTTMRKVKMRSNRAASGVTPGGRSIPSTCQEDEDEDGADDGDAISSLERNADKAKWIVESALGTSGPGIDGFHTIQRFVFSAGRASGWKF